MKRPLWLLIAVFIGSIFLTLTLASPSLARPQSNTAENPTITTADSPPLTDNFQDIIIYLRETADLTTSTLPQDKIARRTEVVQRLQATAIAAQADLLAFLEAEKLAGRAL
jgi:hypothetical protein